MGLAGTSLLLAEIDRCGRAGGTGDRGRAQVASPRPFAGHCALLPSADFHCRDLSRSDWRSGAKRPIRLHLAFSSTPVLVVAGNFHSDRVHPVLRFCLVERTGELSGYLQAVSLADRWPGLSGCRLHGIPIWTVRRPRPLADAVITSAFSRAVGDVQRCRTGAAYGSVGWRHAAVK